MHEGCGGSGGFVVIGGGEVGAGAGAAAAAGAAAGAEALDADGAGALLAPSPAPAGAAEGALPPGDGVVAEVADPRGASVTAATGIMFPSGPRVGTRGWTPPGARAARPPFESRATSCDRGPESMTASNAADDPSAHTVATLLLLDRARMRRVRRLTLGRRLDLGAALGVAGSSSSQKDVFRSQNQSSIRIPPLRSLRVTSIERIAEHPVADGSAPPGLRGQEQSGRTGRSRRNGTRREYTNCRACAR